MRHVRELPGDGVRLHLLTVFILVPAAFNLHLLTRPVLVGEAVYYTKVRYKLSDATALAELLPELDWMDTPPEEPIRPMPYGALKLWMHTFRACRSATICKLKITTKAICKPRNLKLWRH